MQGLVGLLRAVVGTALVEVAVDELPVQGGPAAVEHPVDEPRRRVGGVRGVAGVGLELGADVLVLAELGLGHVVPQAARRAVAAREGVVEQLQRVEGA